MQTRERTNSRWIIPGVAAGIGVAYLIAGLLGGDQFFGFFGLGLMLATGLTFLLLAKRSETIAGLVDRRDERINRIDSDATLFAGMTTLGAVLTMFLVEIAQGRDGSPYYQLGALSAAAYLAALTFLRFRR